MNYESIKLELETKGYVIIPDVLTHEEIDEYKNLHKYGEVLYLIMINSIIQLIHMEFINFVKLDTNVLPG